MAYKPLNLGSNITSRESLDSALVKINDMLGELFTTTVPNTDIVLDGGSATITIDNITVEGNDLSTTVDGGAASSTITLLTSLTDVDSAMVPTINQVLKFNGTTWTAATDEVGSSSLPSRTTVNGTTNTIANTVTSNVDIVGYKGYVLYKIQTSEAAWVRLYINSAARTADALRLQGDDPAANSGVIVETISTGAQTIIISPGVHGFNDEATPTTTIPMLVTNLSGSTTAITVTLTLLQLEV